LSFLGYEGLALCSCPIFYEHILRLGSVSGGIEGSKSNLIKVVALISNGRSASLSGSK